MNIESFKSCARTGVAGAAIGIGAGLIAGGTASAICGVSVLLGVSFAASQGLELIAASFPPRSTFQSAAKAFLVGAANFHIIGSALATSNLALGLFSPFGLGILVTSLGVWQFMNFVVKVNADSQKLHSAGVLS